MRIFIDKDEWYPVYEYTKVLTDHPESSVEVSEKQLKRWERAALAFSRRQHELKVLYDTVTSKMEERV